MACPTLQVLPNIPCSFGDCSWTILVFLPSVDHWTGSTKSSSRSIAFKLWRLKAGTVIRTVSTVTSWAEQLLSYCFSGLSRQYGPDVCSSQWTWRRVQRLVGGMIFGFFWIASSASLSFSTSMRPLHPREPSTSMVWMQRTWLRSGASGGWGSMPQRQLGIQCIANTWKTYENVAFGAENLQEFEYSFACLSIGLL